MLLRQFTLNMYQLICLFSLPLLIFLPVSAPEYMISVNATQRVTLIRKHGGTANFSCGFIPSSVNTARLSLQGDHVIHGNMRTESGEFL